MSKLTPSLVEYLNFRDKYQGFIVFYQIGDFYEVFFEDAKKVASALNITLTSRDKTVENPVPMCGVPVSSIDNYLTKLLESGFAAVIVSQRNSTKGTIHRYVDKIVTPGIRIDLVDDQIDGVLGSLRWDPDGRYDFAYTNVSLKEIYHFSTVNIYDVVALINIVPIKELLVCNLKSEIIDTLKSSQRNLVVKKVISNSSLNMLKDYISNLGFNISDWEIKHNFQEPFIDNLSLSNLNILSSDDSISIFDCIKTVTSQGQQNLKTLFLNPYTDIDVIKKSHAEIDFILKNVSQFTNCQQLLKKASNLEKITIRLDIQKTNIKDLKNLKKALLSIQEIIIQTKEFNLQIQCLHELSFLEELIKEILKNIEPINIDSETQLDDPNLFLQGYFDDLDELRNLKKQLDSLLGTIEEEERSRTGISNLKVKVTQNFGIVIEVTNSFKKLVPSDYVRKQTLVNCERYTTQRLLDLEGKIAGIDEQVINLNKKYFDEIAKSLHQYAKTLRVLVNLTAKLDVLIALAIFSQEYDLSPPTLVDRPVINIDSGFHPILKHSLGMKCQTNNFLLNENNKHFILTGPNMGGKSTFLRQIGVTVFLNQIGCFVPAKSAELGIFSKIRTRIGASDSIFKGISTFMAECLDVSNIIKNCSPRTLVLIDELGRGTNSDEGLAFCIAVLKTIYSTGTPCILATHFHQLKRFFPNFCYIQTEALQTNSGPVFTHVIQPGISNTSYAFFVAKMAGIPENIIEQARDLLAELTNDAQTAHETSTEHKDRHEESSLRTETKVCEIIGSLDPNSLTPLEALNILSTIKEKLLKQT